MQTYALLQETFLGAGGGLRWHLGIGDPTPIGWFTVAAYFVAAGLCAYVAFAVFRVEPRWDRYPIFWCALTATLLALGVNKQLDLQTLLTVIGRGAAQSEGWYRERRAVQALFIALIAIGGVGGVLAIGYAMRAVLPSYIVAIAGLAFLSCFIVVRAASFHHIDQMLRISFGGVRLNAILELGGIAGVALGALLASFAPARARTEALDLPPQRESSPPSHFQGRRSKEYYRRLRRGG